MSKDLRKWAVVNLDDISVYGTFDTQEEAGQWIFDHAISELWVPEDHEGLPEEWAWLDIDVDYVVCEISDK